MQLELSGPRRAVRRVSVWVVVGLAAIGALGWLLPYQIDGRWQSHYSDGGGFSFAVLALVIGVTLALRNRGQGSAMFTGVLASVGAFAAAFPVIIVHGLAHGRSVASGGGDGLLMFAMVGLFGTGLVMFFGEPILYFAERSVSRCRAAKHAGSAAPP